MNATPAPTATAATSTAAAAGAGGVAGPRAGRLRNGELRRQVAAYLAAHPGTYTAGQIARGLSGRSSGAVANALQALVARGEAALATTAPARYTATPTTTTAALPTAATATASTTSATTAPAAPRPPRARRSTPAATSTTAGEGSAASTRPGPDGASGAVSGPVRRPGGQLYHPRLVSGIPDVTALRKLRAAGVPALLYGPAVITGLILKCACSSW